MIRISLSLLSIVWLSSTAFAQQSTDDPTEGSGPAYFLFDVNTDSVGLVIESPMANYGVTSDLEIPPENHGVPTFQDYNDLRDELSRSIAPNIEGIEASVASKFFFNENARCKYDEGSESIYRKDGEWIVEFDIDFACRQGDKLKDVSINLFDFPGFTTGAVTILNGELETSKEVDGINHKIDLW